MGSIDSGNFSPDRTIRRAESHQETKSNDLEKDKLTLDRVTAIRLEQAIRRIVTFIDNAPPIVDELRGRLSTMPARWAGLHALLCGVRGA